MSDNKDQIAEVSINHQQWLMQPITKTLIYILNRHETRLTDIIANSSMDKDLPDAHIRQLSVQLKTLKTIKKLVSDTDTFLKNTQ